MENKNSIKEKIMYPFYLIFHPFNGFWNLKQEKKGNLFGVGIILFLIIITFTLKNQYTGFILNFSEPTKFNLFYQITGILLPFIIWCVSNWCITTLVDGEGNFKDIIITSAYALIPLILIGIPLIIFSDYITISEASFYSIFDTISLCWSAFLLFSGVMVIHQFSVRKTFITILIAIVGMVIIIFLFVIFFTLVQNIINFFKLLFNEIALRYYI